MPFNPVNLPHAGHRFKKICSVCGTVIVQSSASDFPVCIRADCRQVSAQKKIMPPTVFDAYFKRRAQNIRDSIARDKTRLADEVEAQKKRQEEFRAYWISKLSGLALESPERYPLTQVYSCRRKIVNLPEKRRRRFRDRLNDLLSEAVADWHRSPQTPLGESSAIVNDSALDAIVTQSCTACAGGCCTHGGNHAYLNKENLIRVLRENPELRPQQILEGYLSRIATKTYKDSCIYHTSTGCSLPVALRSSTCLSFFCAGLKNIISAFDENPKPLGAFVLVRNVECGQPVSAGHDQVERTFIATAEGAKEL